jgi:hypothetical protein
MWRSGEGRLQAAVPLLLISTSFLLIPPTGFRPLGLNAAYTE